MSKKPDVAKVQSRIGSKDKIDHKPGKLLVQTPSQLSLSLWCRRGHLLCLVRADTHCVG